LINYKLNKLLYGIQAGSYKHTSIDCSDMMIRQIYRYTRHSPENKKRISNTDPTKYE